jgi:hypothetical protein
VIGESGKLYLAAILDLILSVRRRLGGEREHVQVDACIALLVHR